jgi:hypothetical protein
MRPGDPERAKALAAARDRSRADAEKAMGGFRGRTGMDVPLDRAVDALKALELLRPLSERALAEQARPAAALVGDAFLAYGLGDAADGRDERLAGSVRTRADRDRVARIAEGYRTLRGVVAGADPAAAGDNERARSGVAGLLTDYAAAEAGGDREAAMKALRAKYAVGGDADFARLEQATRFLRQSGAARALTAGSPEEREAAMEQAVSGQRPQGPVEISGRLTLDLEHSTATVRGSMLGAKDAQVRH